MKKLIAALAILLSGCFMPGNYEIKVVDFAGQKHIYHGTYFMDYRNHRIYIRDNDCGLTTYFLWGLPEVKEIP